MRDLLIGKAVGMYAMVVGLIVALGVLWETSFLMYALTLGVMGLLVYTVKHDLFVSASIGTVVLMLLVLWGSGISGLVLLTFVELAFVLFSKVQSYQEAEHS